MTDLKPCPFCGGDAIIGQIDHDGSDTIFCIMCTVCGTKTLFDSFDAETIGDMITKWNRRVNE